MRADLGIDSLYKALSVVTSLWGRIELCHVPCIFGKFQTNHRNILLTYLSSMHTYTTMQVHVRHVHLWRYVVYMSSNPKTENQNSGRGLQWSDHRYQYGGFPVVMGVPPIIPVIRLFKYWNPWLLLGDPPFKNPHIYQIYYPHTTKHDDPSVHRLEGWKTSIFTKTWRCWGRGLS